jgi:anti-sigma-K factor RskA
MPEATESGTKLVSDLGDATQVAVTLEPAGGSPTGKPTGPAVEAVDLT